MIYYIKYSSGLESPLAHVFIYKPGEDDFAGRNAWNYGDLNNDKIDDLVLRVYCDGQSATTSGTDYFVFLKMASIYKLVDVASSVELAPCDFYCHFSFEEIKNGLIIGKSYCRTEDDANCCPSLTYLTSIVLYENNLILKQNELIESIISVEKTASGLFEIPVTVNDVLKIYFILDSGASEVSISADVVLTLLKTKSIRENDWLEGKYYRFSDGTVAKSERSIIRSLKIGEYTLYDIEASIENSINAPMLLGQNVLRQLEKVTFDFNSSTVIISK